MNHLDIPGSDVRDIPSNGADALSTCFATSFAGIIAFLAVATEGSFAKAGERLGIGRSAVSRNVQKLEKQLCTRLFLRTTRATHLTREGQRFFDRCNRGMSHIVDAVNEIQNLRDGPPCGVLRISSPVAFGRKVVAPLLPKFSNAYPGIALELVLNDDSPDFASDQIDVAFRSGHIEDSSIIARKINPMQMVLCASRSYLERRGVPSTIHDLKRHDCINFKFPNGRISEWEFKVDGRIHEFLPASKLTFNDEDLVLKAVLDGYGIAQLGAYQVCDHVAREELDLVLQRYASDDKGNYICYTSRQHLPSRTRVFVDFMTDEIRARDVHCLENHRVDRLEEAFTL
ncbi:LysR family transcriptional regulator [Cupriavidus sp. RAF12]|uniref:LysR family transcriptional regulator n=1 Tax=Cupriavidus sp. RAF12 TaxID=3233050 RepID=UPI003F8FF0DD